MCIDCVKCCLFYSPADHLYTNTKLAVHQRLESISERYVCGNLLFDNSHHLGNMKVQKQSLTCVLSIEKVFCVNKQRSLKLKPTCHRCGEKESTSNLWGVGELHAKNITNDYQYFPLCAKLA